MTNMRLENKLCDTCKVNRVYDVCDRKHGMMDVVTGCPNYIPTEFYYRNGQPWPKGVSYGSSYSPTGMKNEDIIKEIKEADMEKQLIKCASNIGLLTKETYDFLYDVIWKGISANEHNSVYHRDNPEGYKKCLEENTNICIGRFFAYIQRMEDNGTIFWDDFLKELERNNAIYHGKNITVSYNDGNIQMKQEFFSSEGTIRIGQKRSNVLFQHGWTQSTAGQRDKKNCVIEVFKNKVYSIEKGKADWITSIRRYTLTFKNKQKMYFDML